MVLSNQCELQPDEPCPSMCILTIGGAMPMVLSKQCELQPDEPCPWHLVDLRLVLEGLCFLLLRGLSRL